MRADGHELFQRSKHLVLGSEQVSKETEMAPKRTLRGQLQRWRDETAKKNDEGTQFVLEDNLLNHLLEASSALSSPIDETWLAE